MVFNAIERTAAGDQVTLAEASAMKLYSSRAATEVAMEAVQLFGGNGYMAEYRVEQLARDAKSLMIYAGSNEIQVTHVAAGCSTATKLRAHPVGVAFARLCAGTSRRLGHVKQARACGFGARLPAASIRAVTTAPKSYNPTAAPPIAARPTPPSTYLLRCGSRGTSARRSVRRLWNPPWSNRYAVSRYRRSVPLT